MDVIGRQASICYRDRSERTSGKIIACRSYTIDMSGTKHLIAITILDSKLAIKHCWNTPDRYVSISRQIGCNCDPKSECYAKHYVGWDQIKLLFIAYYKEPKSVFAQLSHEMLHYLLTFLLF